MPQGFLIQRQGALGFQDIEPLGSRDMEPAGVWRLFMHSLRMMSLVVGCALLMAGSAAAHQARPGAKWGNGPVVRNYPRVRSYPRNPGISRPLPGTWVRYPAPTANRRPVYPYPAGWNRGQKTGWGGCNVPPGQARKYGYGCGPTSGIGRYDPIWRNRNDGNWSNDRIWRDGRWIDRNRANVYWRYR